jgi:diguanylate cyclase (GGDEF)-like protein
MNTWRLRWRAVGLVVSFTLVSVSTAFAAPVPSDALSAPITTALGVHKLRPEQAARALPVHLRAVVTYYDPYIDSRYAALFLQDASGGIFVAVRGRPFPSLRTGALVELSGVTAPGDFAPIVNETSVQVLDEHASLPDAPRVTMSHLLTGVEDSRWVAIEGMVHSVLYSGMNLNLRVMTDGGPMSVLMVREQGVNYANLIDARVLIRGDAGALYNSKRQLTGIRLMVPDIAAISIEDAARSDPFDLPVLPLDNVMQYGPNLLLPHRVHVRGRVTLDWPGRSLCLQNGHNGLCVQIADKRALNVGELVDVAGFPALMNYEPTLSDAILRRTGDEQPVSARNLTADEASTAAHSAELVRIEGRLIGKSVGVKEYALLLSSGRILFPAVLPNAASHQEETLGSNWIEGSRVSVTGIFSAKIDADKTTEEEGFARLDSFQILLRSPADVVLLSKPSWWNGEHTLMVLSAVGVLTLAVAAWVVVLRRRVQQQTQLIRLSEERFRRQAQQDSLTGAASRALFHEHLQLAIADSMRSRKPVALLMMDLDNFKQVNDSLGHHTGDAVLCTTADRIRACVRKTDTVARMGGDEFVVLLPDAPDPAEVLRIAAEVVALVSSPVEVDGHEVPVSMSVGIAIYPDDGRDPITLLKNVDLAMYRAKATGRNCYQVFTPELAASREKDRPAHTEFRALAASSLLK